MLEVTAIDTYYGNAQALFGLSMQVQQGECVALLGRNGVGKTTTLRSIMRLTPPRTGSVRFKGQNLQKLSPYKVAQAGIAFVLEDRRIFPTLTVEENLQIGGKASAEGDRKWTLHRVYELFPRLQQLRDRSGGFLSGGEQQLLAIARAVMGNPEFLLLDEPTEGLAPIVVENLVAAIETLKREGMTLLLVEQNINVALALADRCYVVDHGTVVEEGTAERIRGDTRLRHELLGV